MGLNFLWPSALGPFASVSPAPSFSVASFLQTYVFKLNNSLFPALSAASVSWISNTGKNAAHSCAADDLELSLGNDQIELFDNYLAPQGKQPPQSNHGFPAHLELASIPDADLAPWGFDFPPVPDFSSTPSLSSSYQTSSISSYPDNHHHHLSSFSHPYDLPEPRFEPPKSHFALNMIGLNPHPHAFFNDFRRSPKSEDSPMGASTSESLVLFMDELFIKNTPSTAQHFPPSGFIESPQPQPQPQHSPAEASKKRKHVPAASPEMKAETYDFKKIKVENSEPQVEVEDRKEGARFVCSECNASFKVKSYLTRHARKHNNAMAFRCPFHDVSTVDGMGNVIKSAAKCHHTGGFSRRDTYKTHLKALHFIYPPGTKSSARNSTGGRCAGCFEYFESNARWLKYHIECDQCKGLQDQGRNQKSLARINGQSHPATVNGASTMKTETYD